MIVLAVICVLCAVGPAALYFHNLRQFKAPPQESRVEVLVSVLIPARDEEANIRAAVACVLHSAHANLEVIVLSDHSSDRTAEIVEELGRADRRVRLLHAPPLPVGWCGKVHACHVLSGAARGDVFVFLDADVRISAAGVGAAAAFLKEQDCAMASGLPRQITGSLMEKLLIPLIHFVLLGFLPLQRMRRSTHPAYASGVGQLIVASREGYLRAGGHAAICHRVHDGMALARAFRQAGLRTDVFDATDLAACRMYETAAGVWRGLGKNATEAMASPSLIVPCTALLFLGQVLPWVLTFSLQGLGLRMAFLLAALSGMAVRFSCCGRFRQSYLGAALHPLAISLLIAIQWQAFFAARLGARPQWKGRSLPRTDGA